MARSFDGVDDVIVVTNPGTFNFGSLDYTVAARIYPTSVGAFSSIVSKASSWSAGGKQLSLVDTNSAIRLMFDSFTVGARTSSAGVTLNAWNHVAVTFRDSDNRISFYLNGAISGVNSLNLDTDGSSHTIRLGQLSSDIAQQFAGRMAEFSFWQTELSAAEVLLLSNNTAPTAIQESNLRCWLPICGDENPEPDRSGNTNNGSVTGTTKITHPVANDVCVPQGTNACHRLNMVLDTKRPHITWVQDILALFRSAAIYSNGTHKIISDRADLPLRQVFHAGNMVPGRTEIRVGTNPIRPNQITAEFLDASLNYERQVIYAQNSQSIVTDNDPISNLDLGFYGMTARDEVLRASDLELQWLRTTRREITWETGLEALAVEPGDVAAVGIPTTNFEMGYGGRALDGSSGHIVCDRDITVSSGYAYELLVWHTAADTPETRTIATTVPAGQATFTTIAVSPTAAFNYQVRPGDRYAIGISSEDLIRVRITKVSRNHETGNHVLTGQEYLQLTPTVTCPGTVTTPVSNASPSQPSTASFASSGCYLCVNVVTVPSCVGGLLTVPGTLGSVTLSSSHNPNVNALVGDQIAFVTGPASGVTVPVSAWGGSGSNVATVASPFSATSVPASGNSYYVQYRTPPFGGLEIEVDSGNGYQLHGVVMGTSGCIDIFDTAEALGVRLTPFSDRGARNAIGQWVGSVSALGCRDWSLVTDITTVTGSANNVLYASGLQGGALGTAGRVKATITGLVTETCSPYDERTDLYLSLMLGTQTLISSLEVRRLGDTGAYGSQNNYGWGNYGGATITGTERAVTIEAEVIADNATNRQIARLRYIGVNEHGQLDVSRQGTGTVDTTLANTLAVLAQFSHYDSASVVHSHGCYFLVLRSAVREVSSL